MLNYGLMCGKIGSLDCNSEFADLPGQIHTFLRPNLFWTTCLMLKSGKAENLLGVITQCEILGD